MNNKNDLLNFSEEHPGGLKVMLSWEDVVFSHSAFHNCQIGIKISLIVSLSRRHIAANRAPPTGKYLAKDQAG